MKVLMQNRPKGQWIGGDQIQLEKTMIALEQAGVDVSFNDQPLFTPAILLSDFDIVHLWNFSMLWTKYQLWAAKRQGRKIVCSMIYHPTEAFIPFEYQQIMADNLDAMIFLTEGEVERTKRFLDIPDDKIHIIPNGIDSYWLTTPKQKYHLKDYVLTVGRLDGSKGQLQVAMACKKLGLKYICAGERNDESYAKRVEAQGAILLGAVPHKDLIPLYDNAKLHVLASAAEIFPLCVMEAGARGINSVVTNTCEWKDIPNVTWCTYADKDSIEKAITHVLAVKKNKKFKTKLKDMTWDAVGKQVLEVYKQIYG